MSIDAQAMLDAGTHRLCGCGQRIIRTTQTACSVCATGPRVVSQAPKRSAAPQARGQRTAAATIPREKLGGFASLPKHTLWLVVRGVPVPQGSMRAIAAGVAAHDKSAELTSWRTAIHRELVQAVGVGFVAPDCPMRLHACLTMPGPKPRFAGHTDKIDPLEPGRARVAPSTKPDLDKLERAVGDALDPKGKGRTHAYTDDGRIVESLSVETFARPEHVHAWALDEPGLVVRVMPAHIEEPFPLLSLVDPGVEPPEVAVAAGRRDTMSSKKL